MLSQRIEKLAWKYWEEDIRICSLDDGQTAEFSGPRARELSIERSGDSARVRMTGWDDSGRDVNVEYTAPFRWAADHAVNLLAWPRGGGVATPPADAGVQVVRSSATITTCPTSTFVEAVQMVAAEREAGALAGLQARGAVLDGVKLDAVSLAGADLREASLRRAQLTGVDLSGAKMKDAVLDGASFVACLFRESWMRAVSAWTHDGRVIPAEFKACAFYGVDFGRAVLEETMFEDCVFVDCSFEGLLSGSLSFYRCYWQACRDAGAAWYNADVRGGWGSQLPQQLAATAKVR